MFYCPGQLHNSVKKLFRPAMPKDPFRLSDDWKIFFRKPDAIHLQWKAAQRELGPAGTRLSVHRIRGGAIIVVEGPLILVR